MLNLKFLMQKFVQVSSAPSCRREKFSTAIPVLSYKIQACSAALSFQLSSPLYLLLLDRVTFRFFLLHILIEF